MEQKGHELLGAVFKEFIDQGHQMFCGMRLAPTEKEHCEIYYGWMYPNHSSVIVDLGCGIGGCGYYLNQIDPSLRIINVVNEQSLIDEMTRLGRFCINASFDDTPLPNKFADVVMFNESIGYGDLNKVFKEASRILVNGGILTIKDFSPLDPFKTEVSFDEWDYLCHRPDIVIAAASRHGLFLDKVVQADAFMDHWYEIMGDNKDMKRILGENPKHLPISQTLYRFIKAGI